MDRIALRGLRFFAYHGVLPEERQRGQPFVVDLILETDLAAAGQSDALEATIDYRAVYEAARAVVEGPPRNLIEAVAEGVATATLDLDPRIVAVEVTVRKPAVPLPGRLDEAAVTIRRSRN